MHGQIGGGNSEPDVIRLHEPIESQHLATSINSTKQVRRSCDCSTERLALRKKAADTRWRRRKGSHISCTQSKIGLRSWKQRSRRTVTEPSAQNNGSIAFTWR